MYNSLVVAQTVYRIFVVFGCQSIILPQLCTRIVVFDRTVTRTNCLFVLCVFVPLKVCLCLQFIYYVTYACFMLL